MPYTTGPAGGYSRIQPPFFRGWIQVETSNGKTYKYVRNSVKNLKNSAYAGDSGFFYFWGDTRLGYNIPLNADSYLNTSDTVGRIKWDFDRLTTLWQAQITAGASSLMKWPEVNGDTTILVRSNREQVGAVGTPISGDTYSFKFYGINPYTRLRLLANNIQSISVIEERMPMWYQGQADLHYPGGPLV
jgi:hypothetical protein